MRISINSILINNNARVLVWEIYRCDLKVILAIFDNKNYVEAGTDLKRMPSQRHLSIETNNQIAKNLPNYALPNTF